MASGAGAITFLTNEEQRIRYRVFYDQASLRVKPHCRIGRPDARGAPAASSNLMATAPEASPWANRRPTTMNPPSGCKVRRTVSKCPTLRLGPGCYHDPLLWFFFFRRDYVTPGVLLKATAETLAPEVRSSIKPRMRAPAHVERETLLPLRELDAFIGAMRIAA